MSIIKFLDKYGTNTTTNFDLMDIANDLNMPLKVVMKDELKRIKNSHKNIIMNFQNSRDKGSHWIAIRNSSRKYYFDPYGIIPPKEVSNYLKKFEYSTFQIQPMGTTMCGQLSLYVLYELNNKKQFHDIILNIVPIK